MSKEDRLDWAPMHSPLLPGLEILATAVMLLDSSLSIGYVNPAAENLFEQSRKSLLGQPMQQVLGGSEGFAATVLTALGNNASFVDHQLSIAALGRSPLHLNCTITPVSAPGVSILLEFRPINQQLKIAREERILDEQKLNRELIRNLAHEIRNPLGGIRGAAQLLERELERPELCEYTQVITHETDRLQSLMNRLLTPSRVPVSLPVNIHEVLERVRSLILAEFPHGITIAREYDTSLPEIFGDSEQLIQAVLNVVRNAAQALRGNGSIGLKTSIGRQVTLARKRYRLALVVRIIDDGPGIPPDLQHKIFYPLVSGREDGSGLGLTLAQDYISHHRGIIEFDSVPGRTCFSLILPLPDSEF